MADSNYRSYRRDDRGSTAAPARDLGSDPLAELARLIGQSDPFVEADRDARRAATQRRDNGTQPSAAGRTAEQHFDRYETSHEAHHSARYEAATARAFDEAHYAASDNARYADDPQYSDPRDTSDYSDHDTREVDDAPPPYADEYEDEAPSRSRRSGLIVVVAVLGLAVVGTAGAFGYRAMFGGTMVPSLPPIIKANEGPNKVVPAPTTADAKAKASYDRVASLGQDEKVVPREEQPVEMKEPPKPAPRIISTIPVAGGSPTVSPLSVPPPAAPSAPLAAAPATPAGSAEPKKIRTVVIRPDQAGGLGVAPAVLPPTRGIAPPAAVRRGAAPAAPVPSATEPLALVQPSEAAVPLAASAPPPAPAPARTRTAARAPISTAPAASSSGGYAVQVSSQRSEAEAQSAFRSLQGRFPTQLSKREAIVRRADLGSKGVYFRALVGPFASMEEAAGLCSSLKAAGGTCIVQKN